MVNGISQGTGNSLFDMLRAMQKEQEEMLESTAPEVLSSHLSKITAAESVDNRPATSLHSGVSNLMAGNFFNQGYKKSKYAQASLDSFDVEKAYAQNKFTNLVGIIQSTQAVLTAERESRQLSGGGPVAQTTADPKYILSYIANLKGSHSLTNIYDEDVNESSKEHLDRSKKAIEQAAQEAIAPKDANGNPIEIFTPESGEGLPKPAPAPEYSTPSVDFSETPDLAVAGTPMPVAVTPAPPAAPSIDIRV